VRRHHDFATLKVLLLNTVMSKAYWKEQGNNLLVTSHWQKLYKQSL